ncbi:hypothetical protein IJI94_02175 [Candidatus Saccharibacteria bacterium]|nr:hypothetical protein [Candidatus Saccharibacteria bacterium]
MDGYKIVVHEDEVYFADDVDRSTASWDDETNTLVLANYNGGSVCLERFDGPAYLQLEGENTINTTDDDAGFLATVPIIVNGNGVLNVSSVDAGYFFINGGAVNILAQEEGGAKVEALVVNDGNFYSERSLDVMILNQFGGNLSVNGTIVSMFVVFDGGTAVIDGGEYPAISTMYSDALDEMFSSMYYEEGATTRTVGNMRYIGGSVPEFALPLHGSILFNSGDVSLKSNTGAIGVQVSGGMVEDPIDNPETYIAEKGKDYFIMFADDMAISPSGSVVDTIAGVSEYGNMVYSTFSDGSDNLTISGDLDHGLTFSSNVLKSVRISKTATPVPPTSGPEEEEEEVPNTIDAEIIVLAFSLFFAIIVEGAIIADLYRRLFGYKAEAATIDQEIAKSEPLAPEKS